MTRVADAIAVVTGGASGIGRGIAEVMISRGATVIVADIERSALTGTAAEIGARAIHVDVSSAGSVDALAAEVVDTYGRVDIVVNNAGVGPLGRLSELTEADWRWMLDVNLMGVVNGIHSFLPLLRSNSNGGHIVNTASMSAFAPLPHLGAYAATKAAVAALTEVLARELLGEEPAVGVTLLTPGAVRTGIARSLRNRPPNADGALRDAELGADPDLPSEVVWRTAREIGVVVADAVERNEFYVITHPEMFPRVHERHRRIEAAFARAGRAEGQNDSGGMSAGT